jgi:hypothetical protein
MIDIAGNLVSVLMTAAQQKTSQQPLIPMDQLWKHISSLDIVEALTFISFGTVCLFYGWRVFKILVTICFGLLGLCLGNWANVQLVQGHGVWLSIIGAIFFAALSIPFMRWGVTILGAISGAVLVSGVWLAAGLQEDSIWMGAIFGLVAGGMVSFHIFKIAVILFTGLGGSVLLAMGALAILYNEHVVETKQLESFGLSHPWFLPVFLLAPLGLGFYLQHRSSRGAPEFGGE